MYLYTYTYILEMIHTQSIDIDRYNYTLYIGVLDIAHSAI